MHILRRNIFFSLKQLKISTVADLVKIFKSEALSRKMLISERLGSGMHLRNENEPKTKQIKTFPHILNAK